MPSYAQNGIASVRNDSALFRYVFDIPGEYINDHCLIYDGALWHLYFIEGSTSAHPWYSDGNQIIIGHATSPDLLQWTHQEPALRTGPPGSLDAGHVTAPYVIKQDGLYYMYYGGKEGGVGYFAGEHLLLATSTDLANWTRYPASPIMRPDTSWACYWPPGYNGGSGGPISGRDAHLIADPKYGFVFYYVARLRGDTIRHSVDQEYSCIAAATSPDLVHWTDRGPLVIRKTTGTEAFTWNHPESPCVFKREGLFYLFWKGGNGTRYVTGDDPLHFFDSTETFLATSHASEIFEWKGQWYITSCSREINDITHSYSDRTKGLFLAGIVWKGIHPEVVPLDELSSTVPAEPLQLNALYPLPVHAGDPLHIEMDGPTGSLPHITIFDMLGKEISLPVSIQGSGREIVLQTSGMAGGVYLARIELAGEMVVKRFVLW
jgi:hypothetical protein